MSSTAELILPEATDMLTDEQSQSLCDLYLENDKLPFKPYPYQARAIIRIITEQEEGRKSTLLVLPTGCGKTVVFLLVAKYLIEKLGWRVLIKAHRGELVNQAANAAMAIGLKPSLEWADEHARPDFTRTGRKGQVRALLSLMDEDFADGVDFGEDATDEDPKLVIGMVQTLQGTRLKKWPKKHFNAVITDEAHHATAGTYTGIIEHFEPDFHLGVSATPDRGDGTAIVGTGQVFETLAYEYSMTEAVMSGFLARPWFEMLPTTVDLSLIRTTAGDLNAGDLEKAITPHIDELVNTFKPHIEGRRFIIFTPDIGSAEAVASALVSVGVSCASVSGKDDDRDETIAAFKDGRYQGIANCALLTEGFDAPFVDAIVILRPTKSRALFVQMIGRGTRRFANKKDTIVIGFNWKTFKHKLVKPTQLYHNYNVSQKVREEADALIDSGECADPLVALRKAKDAAEERQRLKVKVKDRPKKVKKVRFDPLGLSGNPEVMDGKPGEVFHRATDGQIAYLESFGFKPSATREWSKARAGQELDLRKRRREAGLCTYKQENQLKRFGYKDASEIKFDAAKKILDFHFNPPL